MTGITYESPASERYTMKLINNSSSNDSYMCESLYDGKQYLTELHKCVLIIFNIVIILLNIVANFTVIHILLKKRLLKNHSMRLIFYLGISDCCVALFAQPVFCIMLAKFSNKLNCTFDTVLQFITVSIMHVSGYITVLIGYDRYCRLKYLNRYSEIIQTWKIDVAMVAIILLSLMQGVLGLLGTQLDIFHLVNLIAVAIDICIIVFTFATYIMTMLVVRSHKHCTINKDMLKNIDKRVTSMSARILLALIVLYTPYITTAMLHHSVIDKSTGKKRENLNFALFVGYELTCLNSFANAIIFLTLNKKTRLKRLMVTRCTKKNEDYSLTSFRPSDAPNNADFL